MPDDGFGEYVPTPTRLQALSVHYECPNCHFQATPRDLSPLLGMLCPECFKRVVQLWHVPFLRPVTFAQPVCKPGEDPDDPLEANDQTKARLARERIQAEAVTRIRANATTRVYRRKPDRH